MNRNTALLGLLCFASPGLFVAACSNDDSAASGGDGGSGDGSSTTGDTGTGGGDGSTSGDGSKGGDSSTTDGSTGSTQCLSAANGSFSGTTSVGDNGLYASGYTITYAGNPSPNTGSFSIWCAFNDAGLVTPLSATVGTPYTHDFTADSKSMTFTVSSLDGGTAVVSGAVGDD
ncbi:MAG: hypothetical protein ACRELY_00890 [Polyangiaceae bacterium]